MLRSTTDTFVHSSQDMQTHETQTCTLVITSIETPHRPPEHATLATVNWFDPASTGVPATSEEVQRRGFAGAAAMKEGEILEVPPDGHCLFSCAVTARDVDRLRCLPQDKFGFMLTKSEDRELLIACQRVRQIVGNMAVDDNRYDAVAQLASADLPEGIILSYVARWLRGSVLVAIEGASDEWSVLFGEGPIVCKLLLGTVRDSSGRGSPHFRLAGSWLPQEHTAAHTPRMRPSKRERQDDSGDSSNASSSTEPVDESKF